MARLSPVNMTIRRPSWRQQADRFGRGAFDRIGHADGAGERAVDGDEHHRLAGRALPRRPVLKRRDVDAAFLEEATVAHQHLAAVHVARDAMARQRVELDGG